MLQFLAVHAPDLRVMFSTPVIFMSWLLKYLYHLYRVFSLNVVILIDLFLFAIFFAFACSMNDLGEPVSANQCSSILLYFVLTQNSLHCLMIRCSFSPIQLILSCSLMTNLPLAILCKVRLLRRLFPLLFLLLRRIVLVLLQGVLFLFEEYFVVDNFFCNLV